MRTCFDAQAITPILVGKNSISTMKVMKEKKKKIKTKKKIKCGERRETYLRCFNFLTLWKESHMWLVVFLDKVGKSGPNESHTHMWMGDSLIGGPHTCDKNMENKGYHRGDFIHGLLK